MPFRRRSNYGRRPKRRYPARKRSTVSLVKRTIAATKETKWVTDNTSAIVVLNSGHIYGLLNVAQGDGGGNRDGTSIKPIGVDVNVAYQANATSGQNVLRCMVVQARKGEGTASVGDLPTFNGLVTPQQLRQYKVLYDRRWAVNDDAAAGTAGDTIFTRSIRLHRGLIPAVWHRATTTAVAADDGGAIQLFFISDGVSPNGPLVTYDSIVRYKDM